jgi:UDP-glucuronate decarboxylase
MAFGDGRVVSNFIVQALQGHPITIYGDGQQTRSFCYVTDLVDGLVRAAKVETFDPPINLGNPGEFTMLELAETAMDVAGRRVDLQRLPLPSDDPKRRCPDITKARKLLGFEPRVALREGLEKTCENFRARLALREQMP